MLKISVDSNIFDGLASNWHKRGQKLSLSTKLNLNIHITTTQGQSAPKKLPSYLTELAQKYQKTIIGIYLIHFFDINSS